MTDRRRHDRLAVLIALVLVVAAACGSNPPSPSPSPSPTPSPTASPTPAPSPTPSPAGSGEPADADPIYDAIEQEVVALRGLEPKGPVDRQTISEDELGTLIRQMYAEESPPELVAATERAYKALGLMPADESLEDLTIELLSGGVAGFYRDDQKKLYVVSKSGSIGGNEKITFAHEFDHALQDQYFTVFADQDDVIDRSDWILARQAVYEGDATLLMFLWATQSLSPAELNEILSAGTNDPSLEMLERMPAILRETLLWPYTQGLAFAQQQYYAGSWDAVNALYADMPESTEQILHEEKWAAREAPIDVKLPADLASTLGNGWTIPWQDTFGEFQMRVWLEELEASGSSSAAAGWGGDRAAVLNGPNGAWAVVWSTAWDSDDEAEEFEAAATGPVEALSDPAVLLPGAGGTERWILVANDDTTLRTVAGALGLAE